MQSGSKAVRTIEALRNPANEGIVPAAYVNGFTDGQAARAQNASLTAYLRVGIDDYARGFRAGYFTRAGATATDRPAPGRHVANL